MENKLTKDELSTILTALQYSKYNIENSQKHASYEDKLQRLEEVNNAIEKVRLLLKES
jgi:hypothetical protein